MKKRLTKFKVTMISLLATTVFLLTMTSASASVRGALSKAGISNTGNTAGLFEDLQKVVYLVIEIGGFWESCGLSSVQCCFRAAGESS